MGSKRDLFLIYFTDSFEAIGDPFEAIRLSCETIKKANEKIRFRLLSSGLYGTEFPHDWFVYHEAINHVIPRITDASDKLFYEFYTNKIFTHD